MTVRGLMVVVAILGLLCAVAAWIVRAIDDARLSARSTQCRNNLKHIALAVRNYMSVWDEQPPPAVTYGPDGRPWHSWRMLVLPFLESNPYYNQYNFSEPWDSPRNRVLADIPFRTFVCPNHREHVDALQSGKGTFTNYAFVTGPGTFFPGGKQLGIGDVHDGLHNTIVVVEIDHPDILWTEPRDLDIGTMSLVPNDRTKSSISGRHPGGPHVALLSGSAHALRPTTPPATVRALLTIDGGEPFPEELRGR